MSRAGVCVVVVVAALTRVAMAQPSDQPPATPPATPEAGTSPTVATPPPQPAPPAVQAAPPAPVQADPTAPSDSSSDEGPTATGFALEMRLSTDQVQIDSNSFLPVMDTGLFIGHHGGKLTIGVGVELSRITSAASFNGGAGPMDQSTSFTSILVMPGLRGTLARSSDQKTELMGAVDIGYGASWSSSSDSMASDSPTISHFRAQVGPGLRYWVSRSFAVGGIGGLRYDRQSRDSTDGTATQSLSNTSVYGSLSLTGVF